MPDHRHARGSDGAKMTLQFVKLLVLLCTTSASLIGPSSQLARMSCSRAAQARMSDEANFFAVYHTFKEHTEVRCLHDSSNYLSHAHV